MTIPVTTRLKLHMGFAFLALANKFVALGLKTLIWAVARHQMTPATERYVEIFRGCIGELSESIRQGFKASDDRYLDANRTQERESQTYH